MSVDVYPMITATAPPPFTKDAYWRNCERPGRFQDWTLLGIALLAAIPFVCGNLVIFWYRKRKYFRAQGVDLVLASSTAGLIWLISAFVVNQHFKRQKGSFFSICPLWSFWLQFTLGFCFWLSLLALRLHHLYLLSTMEKQMEALQIWLFYIPLLLTPSIIFSLFATVYDASKYIEEDDIFKCSLANKKWKLATFLFLAPLYFCIILFAAYRLRGQRDVVLNREYRHTSEYASSAFVLYLLSASIYWSDEQDNVYGRCFLTFCFCTLVFFHFWVRMGFPVYLCIFKPESAMVAYENRLRQHGAHCLDKLQSLGGIRAHVSPNSRSSSFQFQIQDFDGIVEAISQAKADIDMYKEKVHQLEEIKNQILSSVEQQEDVKVDPSNAPPAPSPVTVVATSGGELPDDSEIHSIEEGNILVP
ncbi:unnamed protein product [Sphagnum balticum]